MRLLVCNDLHLKPDASDHDVDAMSVPDGLDAVLVVGDLTHRDGPEDVQLARSFVERFDADCPVFYVPGNHDHAPMPTQVVDAVPTAQSGHEAVLELDGLIVVGWGCERRSLTASLDQTEFPAIDARTAPRGERRYAADQAAADVEAACYDVVTDATTPEAAADRLGIRAANRPAFRRAIDDIDTTYERLSDLLAGRTDVLVASHLSPFNTSFDRHHSKGTREEDLEDLHTGSIALKLAVRTHDVYGTVTGHSHAFGYDTGGEDGGRPHYLNLGFRGLSVVDVDPAAGVFSFTHPDAVR
ncbi:metallophosphoesterase [Halorubellus salinus]|uniref:metallophosphoesterase n=1 Tax=Halorubellus salinus TaxID=755309 RepID=UPI001D081CC9|nr:metallophosphoesterase [Halorubellus salinus]